MSTDSQPAATPKWMLVLGWILSGLAAVALALSASMKFQQGPDIAKVLDHLGFHQGLAVGLGVIELACVIAFLIPRTAVFGAILLTGYLGGAFCTHVRVGDPLSQMIGPVIFGFVIWLGLLLRDEHVRAVLPLRSPAGGSSWLVRIGFVLVTLAVAVVALILVQPAEFKVERSITINAPAAEIFPHVNEFQKWEPWNPFSKIDPDAKVSIEGPSSGVGAIYRWQGNDDVGEGSMTITESRPNDLVRIKLDFVKPWPSTATVDFVFKEENQKTLVTWKMHGKNDIAGKAVHMVMDIDTMVGGEYDKGLASLKKVVEEKK